jgi:hypothetical protein
VGRKAQVEKFWGRRVIFGNNRLPLLFHSPSVVRSLSYQKTQRGGFKSVPFATDNRP